MRFFRRASGSSSPDDRPALAQWTAFADSERPSGVALLALVRAAQAGLPSDDARALLAAAYLLTAQLAGLGAIPSEAGCRLVGLAAAVLGPVASRDDRPRALALVWDRYQQLRGRVRGSVYVQRDVEEAFAGRTAWLEPIALDPAKAATLAPILERALKDAAEEHRAIHDVERAFIRDVAGSLGASETR